MGNIIFSIIFIIGIIYGVATGRGEIVLNTLLQSPKNALFIFIDIYVSFLFWGGMIEISDRSGLLKILGNILSILIKPLFKNLDKNSKALEYISLNLACNSLSMGTAATPFGLKAMDELNKLNNKSSTASNEMITFLLLNVGGFSVIPISIITILSQNGSKNGNLVIPFIMIVSFISTLFSTVLNKVIIKYAKS